FIIRPSPGQGKCTLKCKHRNTLTFLLCLYQKDSPSSKLLFAKDIITYRKQVLQFYHDVYHMPPVREENLIAYMQSLNQVICECVFRVVQLTVLFAFHTGALW